MHNHSYENEFNLHVNEISFSYERMSTKTCFEKEAKGNSEMAYCVHVNSFLLDVSLMFVKLKENTTDCFMHRGSKTSYS